MGIYGTSTFYQGSPQTPLAHPRPSVSSCSTSGATTAVAAAVPTQLSNLNPPNTTATDPGLSIHSSTPKGPASSTSGASASSGVRPLATTASFPPGGHPGPNTNANTSMSGASRLRCQASVVILLTVVGIVIGGLEV
ncbi:hypothetical protein BJ165DRAFT_1524390 [Panaeolus papilionaceus]|nr:hypothetical protein BJ165DRAFT_1524390 [Panaeolus papilionaceus]